MAKPEKTQAGFEAPAAAPEPEPASDSVAPDGVEHVLHLQPRHAAWVAQAAQRQGMATARFLETLVRRAYAADPARVVATLPQAPGGMAGTALRR